MKPARKTILLIEDDDSLRKTLSDLLSREGFHVVSAQNGKTGIRLYQNKRVDLVITDIYMSEMDGLDVIETLLDRDPRTKIIAMSAGFRGSDADPLEEALRLGARFSFPKPFDPTRFLAAVHVLI